MTDDRIDYEQFINNQHSKRMRFLTRDDYPDARAKFHRGAWVVEVSVARPQRYLFNTTKVRKTAGKTDTTC